MRILHLLSGPSRALFVLHFSYVSQWILLAVMNEEGWEVVVRMKLAEVSEKLVKTNRIRMSLRTDLAQTPFSKQRRRITGVLEHMSDRSVACAQRLKANGDTRRIAAHARMPNMLPGHQHGSRGSANCRSRVELRIAPALGCHATQVGCLNQLLAVAAQIAVAEVVGQDEDQIRPNICSLKKLCARNASH